MRFAQHVLDDALSSLWVIARCVPALPASILAFSDVPLAVCSSFRHGISPFRNEQYRNQGNKATEKRNSYQKVIICAPSSGGLSLPIAAQFLRCQKAFLLTTAAQNIHVLFRKSPLCRSHFFEWLKTAISSNACGMSTLKSLLPQAFAVSDVHPRPRKRLARCTLDCGFKTSESPALRGFGAERGPITGTSLYLVLKSNGLHRPKIRLKKFGSSPKTVPANIAKKLPSQRCSKPLFIAFFNVSHKRPTFAFAGESGLHTRLSEKDRTQALTRRNRGHFG